MFATFAPASVAFGTVHGGVEGVVPAKYLPAAMCGTTTASASAALVLPATLFARLDPISRAHFTRSRAGVAIHLALKHFPFAVAPPPPTPTSSPFASTPSPLPPAGLFISPYVSVELAHTAERESLPPAGPRGGIPSVASHARAHVDVDVGLVAGWRFALSDTLALDVFLGGFLPLLNLAFADAYDVAAADPAHATCFTSAVTDLIAGSDASPLAWDHGKLLATLPYVRGGVHLVFTL